MREKGADKVSQDRRYVSDPSRINILKELKPYPHRRASSGALPVHFVVEPAADPAQSRGSPRLVQWGVHNLQKLVYQRGRALIYWKTILR